jgi:hypothetical protein
MKFAEFRDALEARGFQESDEEMQMLKVAPYFYQRTTLSVLLALVKSREGAQLENALGNVNTIVPMLWPGLKRPEKWRTGQTYAEVFSAGRQTAMAGLKKALLKVQGFDFVPENLRSETFIGAANKVLEAHDSFGNYHAEPAPMMRLASLGTSIPMPAFHTCMTALWLCASETLTATHTPLSRTQRPS